VKKFRTSTPLEVQKKKGFYKTFDNVKKKIRLLTGSKKFWLSLLTLIGIGVFIYFVFLKAPAAKKVPNGQLPPEVEKDKIPPSTAIISPEDKSWWNHNFEVTIYDSDLGSGLVDFIPGEKGCRYIIEDLRTNQAAGGFRKCDPVKITIPVEEGKTCSSSYSKEDISSGKCKVSTISFDKAGNSSGWKSRVFNIDLIRPEVQPPTNNTGGELELNQNYLFKASISDNSKIIGCWFYVNGQFVEVPTEISPIPCENENQCQVLANYKFKKEGDFSISFRCADVAGNLGLGKPKKVKVTTNHPPKISFCKVNPTQGNTETEFQFEVSATDPDGNKISYLWGFGDGKNSNEEKPIYRYEKEGTFEPKVIVSDGRGGESECQTAWVTVSGE